MRSRFAVIALFALTALGCEDDARDLDHLQPHPVPIDAAGPDTGSDHLSTPDAGSMSVLTAPDAGSNDASSNDAGSEDAGP